jgi:hypothetical protein
MLQPQADVQSIYLQDAESLLSWQSKSEAWSEANANMLIRGNTTRQVQGTKVQKPKLKLLHYMERKEHKTHLKRKKKT